MGREYGGAWTSKTSASQILTSGSSIFPHPGLQRFGRWSNRCWRGRAERTRGNWDALVLRRLRIWRGSRVENGDGGSFGQRRAPSSTTTPVRTRPGMFIPPLSVISWRGIKRWGRAPPPPLSEPSNFVFCFGFRAWDFVFPKLGHRPRTLGKNQSFGQRHIHQGEVEGRITRGSNDNPMCESDTCSWVTKRIAPNRKPLRLDRNV